MRYEPSSEVRQAAARQLMHRVERLMKAELVMELVPVPGDPPPERSALAERQAFEEQEVLAMACGGPLRCCGSEQSNMFVRAKLTGRLKKKTMVKRAMIMRLVDKGLLRWINSSRTAVELVHEE